MLPYVCVIASFMDEAKNLALNMKFNVCVDEYVVVTNNIFRCIKCAKDSTIECNFSFNVSKNS